MVEAAVKRQVRSSRSTVSRLDAPKEARPLDHLRSEVDRLLTDFLRGYWHVPFKTSVVDVEPYWRGEVSFGATPAVDIVEKDDGYKLTAELPGVEQRNVDIKFKDGSLTIKGRKEADQDDEKLDHFLSERRYGEFHRSFRVPDEINADRIAASFKDGVLTVTLPKTAEARKKQKKIAVKNA